MASTPTHAAVVLGVGARAGLGAAAARRLGAEGLHVFVSGRTASRIEACAEEMRRGGGRATAIAGDATLPGDVERLFAAVDDAGLPLEIVVYNAGNARFGTLLEIDAQAFEETWRIGCLGGFLAGQEAARRMIAQGRGSIFFTGATASLRARPPFVAFASAKFGLRAVAQAMARDLGPQGIHVAHFIIDGVIDGEQVNQRMPDLKQRLGEDGMLLPDAIAAAYWDVHRQQRSAWSHEIDLRPWKEGF
ncbi:MAG TPA: SDR family NAD(P)-dependent oxidoreductase [Thermoanaerobaculia bacterium]|nr:SDR family NAD(P)-dependent oxidoreductase [Thermoanaerobaculia bacterium]